MKLHEFPDKFNDLIVMTAADKHIPESAVERDYYIVILLKNLADSEYASQCVFKGGTSLSKCYPGSIERFSEDIDLTFLGMEMSDKACDKHIKRIEKTMTFGANTEKIGSERSNRSKSMYVWFNDKEKRIKLEIGSSVRPDPYSPKSMKSYIHEFLAANGGEEDIKKYELQEVTLNTLDIRRTFIDKLMSVKRHAVCGTIETKVRHIYDVVRLFSMPEIKSFLADEEELTRLLENTKATDAYYLEKRRADKNYDPRRAYDFSSWKHCLTAETKAAYENLHKNLLYTDEKQSFERAIGVFTEIDENFKSIGQ